MIPFHFKPQPLVDAEKQDIILPAKLETKSELLNYLHRAIPLPDYFGHNWDALGECLGDLSWLDRPTLVLIHQDIPLADKPADQRTYLRLLAAAVVATDRLTVVFPEDCRSHVFRLMDSTHKP